MNSFIIARSITKPGVDDLSSEALCRWVDDGGSQRQGCGAIRNGITAMETSFPAGLDEVMASILILKEEAKNSLRSATRPWINGFNHCSQWLLKSDTRWAHDLREFFGISRGA